MIIEFIQLVFRISWFEVDDIMNNTFGAIKGMATYITCTKITKRHFKELSTNEK